MEPTTNFSRDEYELGKFDFRDNRDSSRDDRGDVPPNDPDYPEPPRSFGSRILPLLIGAGALFGVMKFCGRGEPSIESQVATAAKEEGRDLTSPESGLSNLIATVDQALELVASGKVNQVVYEFEIAGSGSFDYGFKLKPKQDSSPSLFGGEQSEKVLYLRGIHPGPERDRLIAGLRQSNSVINSTLANERDVVVGGNPWSGVITTALWLGVAIWMISKIGKSITKNAGPGGFLGDFLSHKGEVMRGGTIDDRFSDLGGIDQVIDELRDLKTDIEQVQSGNMRIKLPVGSLLCGPPGVGKTKIGRSLAGEVECPFMYFDCSAQATEVFVGTGSARIRDSFEAARRLRDEETARLRSRPGATGKEQGVVIMFLDEFDSIGEKRRESSRLGGDSESGKVVNALLNEMDGLNKEKNRNIIVFAATNFAEKLDDALMRPGRFTKQFEVPLPHSHQQRLEILEKLAPLVVTKAGFKLESDQSLSYVARITPGKSGDHLRAILQEACDIARRSGGETISEADLFEATQRLDSGRIRKNYLAPKKHELVAVHEHGHGVAALACGLEVFLVSMLPRGDSYGRVIPNPESLESLANRGELLSRVLVGAGGRAAELATYGQSGITHGASSDLEQIRAIVKNMITTGMLNDHYAISLSRISEQDLRPEHVDIIDKIAGRAVKTAQRLVEAIGSEKMAELVNESIAGNKELVGQEAQRFYLDRLSPELISKLNGIAQEFLEDPIGSAADEKLMRKVA